MCVTLVNIKRIVVEPDRFICASRTRTPVALLFIDLDGLKRLNDDFGHAKGDAVLCEVAKRLHEAVRDTDVVALMSGDEFVVLLDTEMHDCMPETLSARILDLLKPACQFANCEAHIGASIGAAVHPPLPSLADDFLKRAGAAMYQAKRSGKGRARHAVVECA